MLVVDYGAAYLVVFSSLMYKMPSIVKGETSMKHILTKIILLFLLSSLFMPNSLQAAAGQRIALVIGNSAYSFAPLKNPVNDAQDTAAVLKTLGFTVMLKKDVNLRSMEEAVRDFGNQLKRGGVGLFYYAGHGLQVNGINYLVPVGARIDKESDVKYDEPVKSPPSRHTGESRYDGLGDFLRVHQY